MNDKGEGVFKTGNHGQISIEGIEYVVLYSTPVSYILKVVKAIQKGLWLCGIAVHDPFFGECTPDFNCCEKIGRKSFVKIPQTKR